MKKIISAIVSASVAATMLCTGVMAEEAKVVVNGNEIETDVAPQVINDRTMVPLRSICEAMGLQVYWSDEDSSISMTDGNYLYMMWMGKNMAYRTTPCIDKAIVMDVVPMEISDRTMVPVRALTELIPGTEIVWNDETSTVEITAEEVANELEEGFAEKISSNTKVVSDLYDSYANLYGNGNETASTVRLTLDNGGVVDVDIYPQIAPETCVNFLSLVKSEAYEGKIFHRVIDGFVAQGGGYDIAGQEYETPSITGEFIQNGWPNYISHKRGVISMARMGNDLDSASNQFFIMHDNGEFLDGMYSAFGVVTSGMEYIDGIVNTQTDDMDWPLSPVAIAKAEIVKTSDGIGELNNIVPVIAEKNNTPTNELGGEEQTLEEFAQSMGKEYKDILAEFDVEASQVSRDMPFSEFIDILKFGKFIEVAYGCTYKEFLQYNGYDKYSAMLSPDMTVGEVKKVLETVGEF